MKTQIKNPFSTILTLCVLLMVQILSSCQKLTEVPPSVTSVNSENAFSEDVLAAAVINGIFADMSRSSVNEGDNLSSFCTVYPALMADELHLDASLSNLTENWYTNNLTADLNGGKPWSGIYNKVVYAANAAIQGLSKSQTLSPGVKNQLLGDAYFLRALGYFYLTNLYGEIPLVLSTDYKTNADLAKSPQNLIYAQIVQDLQQAKPLLSDAYLGADAKSASSSRITPNRAAAQALLSRVYLYMGNYAGAESEATAVIGQTSRYQLSGIDNVFLANSTETLWQLQPVNAGQNVQEAMVLTVPVSGPDADHPYTISPQLLAAFESGDQRKTKWIGAQTIGAATYYYPNKYKNAAANLPVTENKIIFRLSELYLIRAEARARLGTNLIGAKDDLNAIRNRAGLVNTTASAAADLLSAILKERQVELFLEWGDRWFNLKRTGIVNTVMPAVSTAKGGSWASYKQLCPIPGSDLLRAPNLVQNPGY